MYLIPDLLIKCLWKKNGLKKQREKVELIYL